MNLKKIFTGLAVVALAGGTGYLGYILPTTTPTVTKVQAIPMQGGQMAFGCNGGVQQLVEKGLSVGDTPDNNTGWSGGLFIGVKPQTMNARWKQYGKTTAQPITAKSFPASYNTTNALGESELRGTVFIKRGAYKDSHLVGTSAHRADAGDLRGLANNPCQWATNSLWLVGAASAVGTANQLVVSNPTANTITVKLSAYSSVGKKELGTSKEINIPSNSSKQISLDGIIPQDPRIALQLQAEAGTFIASLQTSVLAGFKPMGTTFIKPATAGKDIYISGLYLPAGTNITANLPVEKNTKPKSELVDKNVRATLRLVNTENSTREAKIYTFDTTGKEVALNAGKPIRLAPQAVLDLSLNDLRPGDHTLRVVTDGVVSAGVQVARVASAGTDITWLAARKGFTAGAASFALGTGRLILHGSQATVTWSAYTANGIELKTGTEQLSGIKGIDLPARANYVTVKADKEIHGGVAVSTKLKSGMGVDWVPFNENISQSSSVVILSEN